MLVQSTQSSSILIFENMNYQYPYDTLKSDLDADQNPYKSKEHGQISHALRQEWYPCSQGHSLRSYISYGSNGPFFRPLLIRWKKLGCPPLSCLKAENEIEAVQQQSLEKVEDEPWMNGSSNNDLLTLCISQEKLVIQAIKAVDENLPSFEKMTRKPFGSFAAQVGLYSSIEAELNSIEWKSDLNLTQLYQNAWQHVLEQFDNKRKGSCASRKEHKCLLDAVWGEACQWPLKALQYSFLGYTLALPKLNQIVPPEESQTSEDTINSTSNPTTITSTSSAMECDYQRTFQGENTNENTLGLRESMYPAPRSIGQVEEANIQSQNDLSNNLLTTKPWTRKSFQDFLFSSIPFENKASNTDQANENSNENAISRKIIFEQRRPTLSDFWRFGGIPGMFHLPELTPQTDLCEAQDYFGFSSTDEIRGNHDTRMSKSFVNCEGRQATQSSSPLSSPLRSQLQQSLSESHIDKGGSNKLATSSSSRQSPVRSEHNPQLTALRGRASTLGGDRTVTDFTIQGGITTSRTKETEQKKRQKRILGRQRYQRYYKRTMLQRQAIQTTIEHIKMEVENSSMDEVKEVVKKILNTPGRTHEELLEEYHSGLKTNPSTTAFDVSIGRKSVIPRSNLNLSYFF